MMRLAFEPRVSTSGRPAVLHRVAVRRVGDAHPSAAVWRHAPVIHYRALAGPLDSATTDTPLLLCYRERPAGAEGRLTALEYHVVFSHEDAGTDLTGLLARWGHTLDIEWVLRVTMDRAGRVVSEEFQGAHHRSVRYTGGRVFGGHPVLQVATRNGTFSDRRRSRYRGALAPAWRQPEGEPREAVLQRFPWISHLSAVEIRREGTLERVPRPERDAPADPRAYVFLQWKRRRGPLVALEAAVRVRGVWYTSAWERRPLAFEGPDAESTAVKLPAGTTEDAIDAIALSAFDPPREGVEVRLVRAFLLDGGDRPRPSFVRAADCRLTGAGGRHLVWQRG